MQSLVMASNMPLRRITMAQPGRLIRIITGPRCISSIRRATSAMCISVKVNIKRLKRTSRLYWLKITQNKRLTVNNNFKSVPVKSSEITPYSQYLSRRDFLKAAGILTGSAILAACAPTGTAVPESDAMEFPVKNDELGDPTNSFEDITHYNNYYEFTTDKEGVAYLAEGFKPTPWTVEVYGLVKNAKTYGIEDLLSKFTQEERIYRLRCVEAWSMVIPWTGFTLSSLLKEVEPTSDAKYVRFETVFRPEEMPGQKSPF